MNISRKNFLICGASAFGALGAFGGNRFFASSGTSIKPSGRPRLRFGVVSDIHVRNVGTGTDIFDVCNNLTFRHALEYFRSMDVDAVVLAGDMTDYETVPEMAAVAETWYSVFPGDRYPDGRPVAKVFVTGNHDWEGHLYNDYVNTTYPDPAERAKNILQNDMAGNWKRFFHEEYRPIYSKNINGYTFIGSHWDAGGFGAETGRKVYPFGRIQDWMTANSRKIDPSLPFFYIQHPHPKDTCYGPRAWGHDAGISTKTLARFSNAIAFSGHTHYPLTDERSIWQGEFTSVGTSSLRYTSSTSLGHLRKDGYENCRAGDSGNWRTDAEKMLPALRGMYNSRQGMLWSVYDECIIVQRREFLSDLDIGDAWVLPLPAAESKPFAFAEHSRRCRAPEFSPGAKLEITAIMSKNRGGKSPDGKETIAPALKSAFTVKAPAVSPVANARLFSMEFTMETPDGKKQTKRIIAKGFNLPERHSGAESPQLCIFSGKYPPGAELRFTATPVNCFGTRGKPLTATFKT